MQYKLRPLNRIFIWKFLCSAIVQIIVISLVFFLLKGAFKNEQMKNISDNLLITDSYTSEELMRYKLLDNQHALELALYNLEDARKLDSVKFLPSLADENLTSCLSYRDTDLRVCKAPTGTFVGITPLEVNGRILGYIRTEKKYTLLYLSALHHDFALMFLTIIVGFIFNLLFFFSSVKKRVSHNTKILMKMISEDIRVDDLLNKLDIGEYKKIANKIIKTRDQVIKLQRQEILATASAQLVHDIRSPLAALNTCLKSMSLIPSEQRILMHNAADRINDIANNLLLQYKREGSEAQSVERVWLLAPLIESIVSEKRFAMEVEAISIGTEITSKGFAAFAYFDASEMKRMLSNLINNSWESLSSKKSGKVTIILDVVDKQICLDVIDNGVGIPADVLDKVTEPGFTLKVHGNGLGLSHAKKTVERWGGNLSLSSFFGLGTKVSLVLPQAATPAWFVSHIDVSVQTEIAILDDDQSVHDAWDQRLSNISRDLKVNHFIRTQDFITWYQLQLGNKIQIFSDYELLGESITGLDVMEALDLGSEIILMTSHYENPEIMERCQKRAIRLLPKNMLAHVHLNEKSIESSYDIVFIDDERYNHDFWIYAAKCAQKRILCVLDLAGFDAAAAEIPKSTPIYIDLNLKDGVRGVDIAQLLHVRGFQLLYITTGYVDFNPENYPFISGVGDKTPPF